jgi:hypothetical protein
VAVRRGGGHSLPALLLVPWGQKQNYFNPKNHSDGAAQTLVRQMENEEEVKPGGWIHTFPHGSVTVIALHRQ